MEINCDVKGIVDHLPTVRNMAATIRVQLAVYDGPCPSQRLSPYDNKIGGYPVSKQHLSILVLSTLSVFRTSFLTVL